MATQAEIEAAAAAIANARGGRRGAPPVANILELLKTLKSPFQGAGRQLYDEVIEDAEAAIAAVDALRSLSESQGGSI